MRYIKSRSNFLNTGTERKVQLPNNLHTQLVTSRLIKEAFDNDITWGGSLLGRLINSIWRMGKIEFKRTQINGILNQLESHLDKLVKDVTVKKCDPKVKDVIYRYLLTQIYAVVMKLGDYEEYTFDERLKTLILNGRPNEGMIFETILQIKKIIKDYEKLGDKTNEIQNLETLIEKLEDFREELLDLEEGQDEDEDEDEDDEVEEAKQNSILSLTPQLFEVILKLHKIISRREVVALEYKVGNEYAYKIPRTNNRVSCKMVTVPDAMGMTEIEYQEGGQDKKIKVHFSKLLLPTRNQPSGTATPSRQQNQPVSSPNTNRNQPYWDGQLFTDSYSWEPIFEALRIEDEDAKNVWLKIVKAYGTQTEGIPSVIRLIEKVVKASEFARDEVPNDLKMYYNAIVPLGKAINTKTKLMGGPDGSGFTGRPVPFDKLILQEKIATTFGDVPDALDKIPDYVVRFSRFIMGLKNKNQILSKFGNVVGPLLREFIEIMEDLNIACQKNFSGLPKKNENYVIRNYNQFLITEAQEDEEGQEDEEDLDQIQEAWFTFFDEKEHEEWLVKEEEYETAIKEFEEKYEEKSLLSFGPKENAIDVSDDIIAIVNTFGLAYKLYASPVIPSGRPDGRISQSVYREYTYIGGGSESAPKWEGDKSAGPGYGPWAANRILEPWEDGVMEKLENAKYRTFLASAEFVAPGPEQAKGSGKILMSFMTDLLGQDKRFRDFRTRRSQLLREYFGITEKEKGTEMGEKFDPNPGQTLKKPVDPSTIEEKTYFFKDFREIGRESEKFVGAKAGEFLKIVYTVGAEEKGMIAYVLGVKDNKKIAVMFHKSGREQFLISKYTKTKFDQGYKFAEKDKIKYDKNEKVYLGIFDLKLRKGDVIYKFAEITGVDQYGDLQTAEIRFLKIKSLVYGEVKDEKGIIKPLVIDTPDEKPERYIKSFDVIKGKDELFR